MFCGHTENQMKTTPERNLLIHENLRAMSQSYRSSRLLLSAVELGVFEAIHFEDLTAKEIAERTGCNERATAIFLDALAGMGLLEKRGDAYINAPSIRHLLSGGSSNALMAYLRHQNNSWRNWSSLTEVIKTGQAGKKHSDKKGRIDLAGAMRYGSVEAAERLNLMVDFTGIRNICDMGCGPGAVCMELMQIHPHLKAVLLDHDREALKIARQEARVRGLQDRIEIVHGDILTEDSGKNFDMVFMTLVLCLFTRRDAMCLLKKAKGTLRPGGLLVLGEVLLSDSGKSPVAATMFAVHLLVSGAPDGLFSLGEIRRMLVDCGIENLCNFPANPYHIIVGRNWDPVETTANGRKAVFGTT